MSTGHMSVQCIELLHRGGARASGLAMDICTWDVTHRGFGKGYRVWGACAKAYTGIVYISLTPDWCYGFVKWL